MEYFGSSLPTMTLEAGSCDTTRKASASDAKTAGAARKRLFLSPVFKLITKRESSSQKSAVNQRYGKTDWPNA